MGSLFGFVMSEGAVLTDNGLPANGELLYDQYFSCRDASVNGFNPHNVDSFGQVRRRIVGPVDTDFGGFLMDFYS